MPSGDAVTSLSVATSESWKDKQTGERKDKTEWHNLVFFRRSAEIAGEYLKKGSQIYVEGKLQTRKWQDTNGNDRYTTEIVVNEFQMLSQRPNTTTNASATPEGANAGSGYQQHAPSQPAMVDDGFDDDIPL